MQFISVSNQFLLRTKSMFFLHQQLNRRFPAFKYDFALITDITSVIFPGGENQFRQISYYSQEFPGRFVFVRQSKYKGLDGHSAHTYPLVHFVDVKIAISMLRLLSRLSNCLNLPFQSCGNDPSCYCECDNVLADSLSHHGGVRVFIQLFCLTR